MQLAGEVLANVLYWILDFSWWSRKTQYHFLRPQCYMLWSCVSISGHCSDLEDIKSRFLRNRLDQKSPTLSRAELHLQGICSSFIMDSPYNLHFTAVLVIDSLLWLSTIFPTAFMPASLSAGPVLVLVSPSQLWSPWQPHQHTTSVWGVAPLSLHFHHQPKPCSYRGLSAGDGETPHSRPFKL